MAMLECQHQEKVSSINSESLTYSKLLRSIQPSIQKLVANITSESLVHLTEEAVNTDTYTDDTPDLRDAARELVQEFGPQVLDRDLAEEARRKAGVRRQRRIATEKQTVRRAQNLPTRH